MSVASRGVSNSANPFPQWPRSPWPFIFKQIPSRSAPDPRGVTSGPFVLRHPCCFIFKKIPSATVSIYDCLKFVHMYAYIRAYTHICPHIWICARIYIYIYIVNELLCNFFQPKAVVCTHHLSSDSCLAYSLVMVLWSGREVYVCQIYFIIFSKCLWVSLNFISFHFTLLCSLNFSKL